jgi:hypothetical protein
LPVSHFGLLKSLVSIAGLGDVLPGPELLISWMAGRCPSTRSRIGRAKRTGASIIFCEVDQLAQVPTGCGARVAFVTNRADRALATTFQAPEAHGFSEQSNPVPEESE